MTCLEHLPVETVDGLVPLLDIHSIFNLCHCLPHLKPLSKAIYDVSMILEHRVENAECFVWPGFELGYGYRRCPPDSYLESIQSGEASLIAYAKLLNRFGGTLEIDLCCERHLHCYRQFLPRRIILTIQSGVTPQNQVVAILRTLALWKVDVEVLRLQPDDERDEEEGLEGVDLSAIQDMRVSTLKLIELSAALIELLPKLNGLKTLQLDDPDGLDHIAPMHSLECLIIYSSDAKHQNVQNAIIKGTHPKLKRVEVLYSKWMAERMYPMWVAEKRCEKRLKSLGWVVNKPKDVNDAVAVVAWTRQ